MFGQPQWFRAKSIGWGLVPVCWQGWAYTATWAAAAALPFLLLLSRRQPVEAMAWLTILLGGLAIDVRQILGAIHRAKRPQTAQNAFFRR